MKQSFLITAALVCRAIGAQGDTIFTIVLDDPNQTVAPGGTVQFFGTVTNNTDTSIYINGDDLNLPSNAGDFTLNDLTLTNTPISLDPNANTGDIELFDVTAASPFPDTFNVAYNGTYDIQGGADSNDQTILNDPVDFSVEVTETPEAPAWSLIVGVLGVLVLKRRRRA
jgi:hypothetical protein